jgi:hypothetical protein
MTTHDTRRLADLVGAKHDCLLQLRDLGRRQQELIDAGDLTRLLSLLADKQRAIGELHDVERQLDPYRAEDPASRVWTGEAERVRCASLTDQSARLLAEILDGEKRCEESLRKRRDETAAQLSVVQAAGAARGAYAEHDTTRAGVSTLDLTSDS